MTKKKENSNSNINCDVESCKYNNCEEGTCTLENIQISSTCDCDPCDCVDCDETACESFEKDDSKDTQVTDNVYEVTSEQDNSNNASLTNDNIDEFDSEEDA